MRSGIAKKILGIQRVWWAKKNKSCWDFWFSNIFLYFSEVLVFPGSPLSNLAFYKGKHKDFAANRPGISKCEKIKKNARKSKIPTWLIFLSLPKLLNSQHFFCYLRPHISSFSEYFGKSTSARLFTGSLDRETLTGAVRLQNYRSERPRTRLIERLDIFPAPPTQKSSWWCLFPH